MLRRLAIACEFATLNGGERSLLATLAHWPAGEVEPTLLAPAAGALAAAADEIGMPRVPLELRTPQGERLPRDVCLANLRAACRAADPHLLHANSLSMGRLTGGLAGELSIPCTAHLRDIISLSAAAVGDLNRHARLVAVSRATREYHVAQGLAAERVETVYNGIDCAEFVPRPRTGTLIAELGLPADAFVMASIGQSGLRKGQDVFARAAAQCGPALPDAHFVLIGALHSRKAESIELDREVTATLARAGMADRLHRLGNRSDIGRLLNEIDLLVHAARQEPFGRVLLEAAASGVPIIATDVGGTREMLGDTAVLLPPDDADALAAAIVELARNQRLRAEFAERARERVGRMFPIDRQARALADVWESVLDHPPPEEQGRRSPRIEGNAR